MPSNIARVLGPVVRVTRVVWFALLTSLPIYAVLARLVSPREPGAIPPPALLATFATVALGLAFAALTLPRVSPSDALLARIVGQEPSPETIALALAPARVDAELLGPLDPIERRLVMITPVFRSQAILRAALAEGIGILGFVFAILSGSFLYVVPFTGLGLLIMLLVFPRIEPLIERARPLARP